MSSLKITHSSPSRSTYGFVGLFMSISILKTFFLCYTEPHNAIRKPNFWPLHSYIPFIYSIYLLRQESSWVGCNRMAFLWISFKALAARWSTAEYKRRNFLGSIYTTLALCHFATHYTNVSKYVMITGQTNQLSHKYPAHAWYPW